MIRLAASLLLACASSALCFGSDRQAGTENTVKAPEPPQDAETEAANRVEKRPPLLREGSFLNRALGTLREDPARAEWFFVPSTPDPTGLERLFVLQPNGVLEEAIRVHRVAPEPLVYELSGEVFVYRGRNYLLAMIAKPAPAPIAREERRPGERDQPLTEVDEEALASELERRLAERIGSVPVTPIGPERSALDGSEAAPPRRGALPADVRVQSRRGQLMRDASTGGWRFVFVGQQPEGGEPSMPILPCLALERVERLVRESGVTPTLQVSGTTTLFEGRNFLLPSAFRIATGGKGIDP